MSNKLKPCLVCNGNSITVEYSDLFKDYFVFCDYCCGEGMEKLNLKDLKRANAQDSTKQKAIELWNKRP